MANFKAVFSGVLGLHTPDTIRVTQNSTETDLVFDCVKADGTDYVFEAGDVATASFVDNKTFIPYGVTGTITPEVDGSTLTWARSAADVGTPSKNTLSFKIVSSAPKPDQSIPVLYIIERVPDGTVVPATPLVGVPAADAAWLALAVATNPTPTEFLASDGSITADHLDFNTATAVANAIARFKWNEDDMTFEYGMDGTVVMQLGQEMVILIRNDTGSTIVDGSSVYITGSISSRMTIALAQADSVTTSKLLGMATEDILNNTVGIIAVFGQVRNRDTNAWTEGDELFLSLTTPGAQVIVEPVYPDISVSVGTVVVKHPTEGVIFANSGETAVGAYKKAIGAQAAAEAASIPKAAAFVTAASDYTTLTADGGKSVLATGAGTITLADGMVAGYQIVINRVAAGAVTITAATTLNKLTDGTGYETIANATLKTTAVCTHLGSDIWLITGDFT